MTPAGALELWETGQTMTPAARAVLLLEAAGHTDVAEWPVGRRDRALLAAYCSARGSLAAVVECPECGTPLDVEVDLTRLGAAEPGAPQVTVEAEGYRVTARSPTAGDLAAASALASPEAARALLLARCLVSAWTNTEQVEAASLPDAVIAQVEADLAAADPTTELDVSVTCVECSAEWASAIDPVRFAWDTVEEHARDVAIDVHALARAYGWSEQEILRLSPFRRALYLSAVQS